jgi:prephenate dehydrogenase
MLISQALMNVAMSDRKALLLAASGFRDMTRLSMSNTEMAQDMINLNKENIAVSLEMLEASVRSLLSDHYREKIEDIKEFRKSMYDNDNNNVINL